MKNFALFIGLLALGGCAPPGVGTGGGSNGGLTNAVGEGTAPYVLLDLSTHAITFHQSLGDLATNANYKDGVMVFRRVGSGSNEVLMGVFDVTQDQWARLDSSTPWMSVDSTIVSAAAHGGAYPVYGIEYDTIVPVLAAFPVTGGHLAVPTAAQWQTATGVTSGWSWGSAGDLATLSTNAVVRETVISQSNKGTRLDPVTGDDSGGPAVVGSKAASPTGLYDLHGNVWQWTAPGAEVRGGSWYDPASVARVEVHADAAAGIGPDVPHALIGVRLILVLQ